MILVDGIVLSILSLTSFFLMYVVAHPCALRAGCAWTGDASSQPPNLSGSTASAAEMLAASLSDNCRFVSSQNLANE